MPKWSDIRALQFLDIYEKQACLWNPKIEDYKNKSARNAAFDLMLAELQIPDLTANDIKLKIKSIRTTYKRELSAVLKAEANRSKRGNEYKPKLFWFHRADSFLRPVSTSRFSVGCQSSNSKSDPYDNDAGQYTISSNKFTSRESKAVLRDKYKQEALEEMTMALNDTDTEEFGNPGDEQTAQTLHETSSEHQQQHHEQHQQQNISAGGESIREETITIAPYRPNDAYETTATIQDAENVTIHRASHEDDEYSMFCKSVEAQLRSIPDSYSRSLAKFKIQQVLFEAETGHYRKNTYVTIPSTQP